MNTNETFFDHIAKHQMAIRELINMHSIVNTVVENLKTCIEQKGTIYTFGNGGSAADALHFTSELVGRYKKERSAIKAVCLNSNVSDITAIANDYGYEHIFSRPLIEVLEQKDIVIGYTTSGKSKNVIEAFKYAQSIGCKTVLFGGNNGGLALDHTDFPLIVSEKETATVQEMHVVLNHIICELTEIWHAERNN